jgi:naphthoate synthase
VNNDPAKSSIVSALNWKALGQWQDIEYHVAEGIAKITINRPEKRNAFRPQTVTELIKAFDLARDDNEVGVIILTGKGDLAFSSGGDQSIRGDDGYMGDDEVAQKGIGTEPNKDGYHPITCRTGSSG